MKIQHYYDDRQKVWVVLINSVEYSRNPSLDKALLLAHKKYRKEQ